MKIPPFKPIIPEKVKAYVDRFLVRHDRQMSVLKKERLQEKKKVLNEALEKVNDQIAEEKLALKENNQRWRMLNILR